MASLTGLLTGLGPTAVLLAIAAWLVGRRRRALAAVAAELGLTLRSGIHDAYQAARELRALADVPVLSRGCRQWVGNEMAGRRDGREVWVFDFHFYPRRHGGQGRRELTVALVPRAADTPAPSDAAAAEALRRLDLDPDWHVEIADGHVAAYRGEKATRPADVPRLVDETLRIARQISGA